MKSPIRVLALIYPIERHVGHWACSSSRLLIRRIIMSGPTVHKEILEAINDFQPEIIAVCGKAAIDYLDILDDLASQLPALRKLPRVFRMQNSSLIQQSSEVIESKELCCDLSLWFRLACDPRWSWVFVQTLNDIDVVRKHLSPVPVSVCPYGYDTAVFDPDLPELDRNIDIGCYMNLRDDSGRRELVREAETICQRRGWSFSFVQGVYWHEYARQIRSSKIALHRSIHREIPFRIYETTVFGTVFVTDPLEAHVEELFVEDREYVTYKPDLSDLGVVLERLLTNDALRHSIAENGQLRARQYTWQAIADKYVAPALDTLLSGTSYSRVPPGDLV
jgi:glycosyltransferase involved in cell wall biosynthesis